MALRQTSPCILPPFFAHAVMKGQVRFLKQEVSMSERESAVLSALQTLAMEHSSLEPEIWHSIAIEALSGSAPAQYIVATALEELGNMRQAQEWFERSAAQGHAPALAKLASYSAALSHEVPFHSGFSAQ
jgi:TPR repeat protein